MLRMPRACVPCHMGCLRTFAGLDLLDQSRHDIEQIANDSIVGYLENRGIGILIDSYHRSGTLHANKVLYRAGDSDRQIEFGCHGLAGTANLPLHWQPAAVANGARTPDLRS